MKINGDACKENIRKEAINVLFMLVACACGSFGMHIFVYPSNFAPAGVDGIATMLQYLTGFNAGVYSLALNIPLLIVAWIMLKKRYVIYTILFTVLTSGLILLLDEVDFYQYVTETDKIISSIFSGVLLGVRTGIMLKIGASTGGADIVASAVQSRKPYFNVERIISIICYVIMGLSFFVYKDVNSILLSVIQLVVFEYILKILLSPTRNAIEVKIVTKNPKEIIEDILFNLKHGATLLESKGSFTEEDSTVILSVINKRQVSEFVEIMKKYPNTFIYYSDVKGVRGNFRWHKDDIAK